MIWMARAAGFVCICLFSNAGSAQTIGSEAELWFGKNPLAKTAFLEGFCQGMFTFVGTPTYNKLGDISCTNQPSQGSLAFRFCGNVWRDRANPAITWLNNFYKTENHSDVPVWAAIATHNDQSCKEQTLKGRLPSIQAKARCARQLLNMFSAGISEAVRDKQKQECDRLQ